MTNDDARAQFLDFIRREHISAIYLHAYGLLAAHPVALRNFIVEAGDVEVELLAGDPSWALNTHHEVVLDFAQDAIAFTQSIGGAGRPVGLHLDIEPYLLNEWSSDQGKTVTQYLDLLVAIKQRLTETKSILLLSVDIPFWYDTIEATYDGETKPLHQHVQDIADCVVIMDYRDTAGGGDGIIVHAQSELIYANKINKRVTVGVETNCIEPAKITFCEEGKAVMERELAQAKLIFQANPAFQGFAIHDYVGYARLSQLMPTPASSPTVSRLPAPASSPTVPPAPAPACPTADAEGTVSPAVVISSITFVVNGIEQIVRDGNSLRASVGDQVQTRKVTICVGSFPGAGGNVYIEFDPVDTGGQVIAPEVRSTQAVRVTPGLTTIPGPDVPWTISNWRHISVVTVHYPQGRTQNPSCEGGLCEVDDRVIVPIVAK